MNKDVIYVEPEDDITDIILKIEKAKEKIVALVPPKKAGVFRSVVNIKLIAKAGNSAEKTVVLVTVDPSIMKLAGALKLPVAKNLQTAPVIPSVDDDSSDDDESSEELVEEDDDSETEGADKEDESAKSANADDDDKKKEKEKDEDEEDEEEEEEEEEKPKKKDKKPKKASKGPLGWIKNHKKSVIFGALVAIGVVLFAVWALVIAPAATIVVGIKTVSNNFSESVTFTTNPSEENAEEGKFYLEERTIQSVQEVQFNATGKKNMGDKASGELTIFATISGEGGSVSINNGTLFTNNGLSYTADESTTLRYQKGDYSVCKLSDAQRAALEHPTPGVRSELETCIVYDKIRVTATQPGTTYNIPARTDGWVTAATVDVISENAMSGGSDKEITVVQQSDIENTKAEIENAKEADNKEDLFKQIGDDKLIIESSFDFNATELVPTPAVDEEVRDGVQPILKATTSAVVYVIDKTKVEEYITKKANLGESKSIYQLNNPYIDGFSHVGNNYTGKLKAIYLVGPKITERDVVDKAKGKGLGEVQHDLREIDGVASVDIQKTMPWMTSVPGDENKISVIFEVKDQNGNSIDSNGNKKDEEDSENEENHEESGEDENKSEEEKK